MSVVEDPHIDKKKGNIKKARRQHKPGDKALKEIKYHQASTRSLVPVAVVRRGIRHALEKIKEGGARITQVAFDMIHESLEEYMVRVFKSAQMMAIHAKRKTLMVEDMRALYKVCDSMKGKEDLSGQPLNPRMSEKHRKTEKKKKESSGAQKKRPKKPIKTTIVKEVSEEEEDDTVSKLLELETEVAMPTKERNIQIEGEEDWFLDEHY